MFGAHEAPTRVENLELQRARAKIAQLELLLAQGKTFLEELRDQLKDARAGNDALALRVRELESDIATLRATVDRARELAGKIVEVCEMKPE
ncbi:MAG TPA: hypothetical protein VFO48_05545 [Vicinamibacterales bacterium]|nr:hypothetical protein [Vicinamibacterales bacterium]